MLGIWPYFVPPNSNAPSNYRSGFRPCFTPEGPGLEEVHTARCAQPYSRLPQWSASGHDRCLSLAGYYHISLSRTVFLLVLVEISMPAGHSLTAGINTFSNSHPELAFEYANLREYIHIRALYLEKALGPIQGHFCCWGFYYPPTPPTTKKRAKGLRKCVNALLRTQTHTIEQSL